ncbi:hypothetical protein HY3_10425 [Hyphomonas pacifica]|uniref:Uncharacterized protein n=1 Tax=Hyphomonas pacifica TaxID=1280941 RepID=A0A062U6N9_9PROT|nr:hypothetical protein HY2_10240 [Hyphomonas pacifica]RAN34551.1 hypothetical protein HY3_10425 [Hyphomonas pacifica]RAN36304.1 hypothetical protein HY11_12115 [Hyphomonas pacifica]
MGKRPGVYRKIHQQQKQLRKDTSASGIWLERDWKWLKIQWKTKPLSPLAEWSGSALLPGFKVFSFLQLLHQPEKLVRNRLLKRLIIDVLQALFERLMTIVSITGGRISR